MTNRAMQGESWIELPVGIRRVGYLLFGLGSLAVGGVVLILLMAFTLPGVAHPTAPWSLLLVALVALASAPLVACVAIFTRRSWALMAAESSLFALFPAGLIALVTLGQMFVLLAPVGLPLLLASMWAVEYLRRPDVRYVYRSIAGPAPLPPARLVQVASRLAPGSRVLGGLGLLGLGAMAAYGAITARPDYSSAWAEFGASVARLVLEFLAMSLIGSGLSALALRNSVIPAAIGAFLTLPLAAFLLAWAPLWLALLVGSVGTVLALSIVLQVVARSRDELRYEVTVGGIGDLRRGSEE